MDTIIWSHVLYELSLSVSSEQKLENLLKKAALAFLKKLDCAHVSILQYDDDHLVPACVIPRVTLRDPAYYELIAEFKRLLKQDSGKKYFISKRELYFYGFPLQNFGLLIMGRSEPVKEIFLKELLSITDMLAQNCFFNIDAVRKRQAVEAELEKERKLLRVIIDTIPDLIFCKDANGVYKVANKAAEDFSSLSGEMVGHTDWDIHSLEEASKSRIMDHKVMRSGHVQRFEEQFKHRRGHWVPLEIIKVPVYDTEGKCTGIVGVSRDITERKHYKQQLEYAGAHDQLTGLFNRRFLEREIKRLDTLQQLPISVIMGDLNGLKLANDVFGHQAGDNLLIKAAEIIRRSCRQEDLIARWGGDEFAVFLPRTDAKTAGEIGQRIKKRCLSQKSGHIQIGITLGWATKNIASENIWQVLKEASDKMHSDRYRHAKTYKKTVISSLKSILSEKSMETEEHAERLKTMCRKIGETLGLDNLQLNKLELLAVLHDIGKVAIKKSILLKPGPLTEEEWVQMKKHPEIGYRFARSVPELSPIAEYILSHHERWDGKGYPQGIKGDDIPLLSRVLAVVDAFDAMTNDRTYRKAMPKKEALAEIIRNAGTQFDPKVVDVFCQLKIAGTQNIQA